MNDNELVQIENAPAAPPRRGGPTSEAGKARSSLNACKHNLTGRTVLLPGDDIDLYQAYLQRQSNAWQPANDKEHDLVQIMVDELWRMRRIREMEDGVYALGHFETAGDFDTDDPETHALFTAARVYRDGPDKLTNLSLYEQRIFRVYRQAKKDLEQMQAQRKAEEQAAREEAILLYRYQKMLGLPYDPKEDQFVFSSEEIAREATRRERLELAKIAQNANFNLRRYRDRTKHREENAAA